jgi:hypothetical protein
MNLVLNSMIILSVFLLLLQAGQRGAITAETIAIFLILVVIALAILSPRSTNRHAKVGVGRALFGIAIPVTSLSLLAINNSSGSWNEIGANVTGVLAVLIAFVGLLIILHGILK